MSEMVEYVTSFEAASEFFVDRVRGLTAVDWARPGLGSWNIRELVAHANRAHTILVDYVQHPVEPAAPDSGYFTPEAIAERGRSAVRDLGDAPVTAIETAAARARALARELPADFIIKTPMGAVRADFYLSSRSSELLIHGNDVARAMGERVELPAVAVRHVAIFLTERAVTKNGELFILAMSGREALPAGFSVY